MTIAVARFGPGLAACGLVGLAVAVGPRVVVAGSDGVHSIPGGLAFGAALLLLTAALGFRRPKPAWSQLAWGGGGAAVLCLPPLLNRLGGDDVLAPPGVWPTWAAMVTLVAIAEELFLRALRWVSGSVTARHDPCAGQSRRMVAAMNRQITTLLTAPPTVASGTARVTGGAVGPVGATSAEQGRRSKWSWIAKR